MAAEAPLRWSLSAIDPRDLLDGLAMAVVVLDPRGDIAYLNAAAQTMLAAGLNQYRGRPLRELVRDPAPLESIIIRAQQNQEPIAAREISLTPTMRSDSQFVVDCTASPLGPDGRVLLEVSDTTRQQRITRDNALLTQLGGSRMMVRQLAHEIKNPLGGLRGAAQLLERELPDAALKEYTRIIISEADRLRALVDNLLGPGYPPRKELVNVHELTQHVFHLVRSEVPGGIVITRDYDPSLPQLYLDRDQLIQAMLNLARNAVQVLVNTGQLVIRTRAVTNVTIGATRHRVVAAVQFEDNGPGVPDELRDKIFYPLVTGRPGGTGLGLAVAQDIATRHNGLIEFESRPGRTIFTILLPLGEANDG